MSNMSFLLCRLISFSLMMCLFHECLCSNITVVYTVAPAQSLLLECPVSSEHGSRWTYNNKSLYIYTVAVSGAFKGKTSLFKNYSLFIKYVAIDIAGTFDCISQTDVIASYKVEVEVTPKVYMFIDENPRYNEGMIEANTNFSATCFVDTMNNSLPLMISWRVNGKTVQPNGLGEQDVVRNKTTFKVSTLTFLPQRLNEKLTCVAILEGVNITESDEATFNTYVIPNIGLTVNNQHVKRGNSEVTVNDTLTCVCRASGGRPAVIISWQIDGVLKDKNSFITNKIVNPNMTFTTVSTFTYRPVTSGNLTCVIFMRDIHFTEEIRIEFIKESIESGNREQNIQIVIVLTAVLLLLLSCGIAMYLLRKKITGTNYQVVDPHYVEPNEENAIAGKPEKILYESTLRSLSSKASTGTRSMKLPEPPRIIDERRTSGSDEQDNYADLPINYERNKKDDLIFQRKDVCLVLSLKMGNTFKRWMGTITAANKTNECVVITTVSENALLKNEVHWNEYVKRLLELPSSQNVVDVKGVCFDKECIYLMQEHLTSDTLKDHLDYKRDERKPLNEAVRLAPETMQSILEILQGLKLIQSFGFLHPGLSSEKILLGSGGVCKLYAFCLAKDAPTRIASLKSKETCALHGLPRESMLRNEYSQQSDVWSVAVLIWELLTDGESPLVQTDHTFFAAATVGDELKHWPSTCHELRELQLTECFNDQPTNRPTISDLIEKVKEVSTVVTGETNTASTVEAIISQADAYVPMSGENITAVSDVEE
ncbi:uncharacterized protein [Apostichopus japonicus]|uniref:uncharacterized protein isoform X2 n=1 Tax=Stichopus japonicus TaxID=307972 RepID=UPI003AB8C952